MFTLSIYYHCYRFLNYSERQNRCSPSKLVVTPQKSICVCTLQATLKNKFPYGSFVPNIFGEFTGGI